MKPVGRLFFLKASTDFTEVEISKDIFLSLREAIGEIDFARIIG